jgi:hypothetical protein
VTDSKTLPSASTRPFSSAAIEKSVTGVIVEVDVDRVQKSALVGATNLRAAARSVMDIVTLEGDSVTTSYEQECPVVVIIARRRPARIAVNLSVRDRNAVAWVVTRNDMLAADERGLHVVDPNQIRPGQRHGVAAPYVLRVELSDVDVLHDDVFDAGEAQPLSTDYAFGAFADDRLVGLDVDKCDGGFVVGYGDCRVIGVGALRAVR